MKTRYGFLFFLLFCCPALYAQQDAGWKYNDPGNGGFQVVTYAYETPPGMVLVKGGTGRLRGDTAKIKRVSFLCSEYEESNRQYRAYLGWLQCYAARFPKCDSLLKTAQPDTSFWSKAPLSKADRDWLAINYLHDPRYDDYPVLGLTPAQALAYAEWKTDRLNELILVREGLLDYTCCTADNASPFSTQAYLEDIRYNPYVGAVVQNLPSLDPKQEIRRVRMEDAILMPPLQLPGLRHHQALADMQWLQRTSPKMYKPYPQRKFDPKKQMPYLFPYHGKWKPDALQLRLKAAGLVPVSSGKADASGLFHYADNAGEMTTEEKPAGDWKSSGIRFTMALPGSNQ